MDVQRKSEIHLFLIWYNARSLQDKIIDDVKSSFEIIRILEIKWSDALYSSNLTRFYGQRLPDRSFKEQHCGKGPFIVIVVRDNNPRYEMRNTSHGPAVVNVNTFDKKQLYRKWTGGGHKIHATDTTQETDHDLVLLTGFASDDFCNEYSSSVSGSIETLHRDLSGACGWESISKLLYVMNHTTSYIILRNFDGIPDRYTSKTHVDIDLLGSSALALKYIINAQPVFPSSQRVLHYTLVDNQKVLFDFRSIGDGYYDESWERSMLQNRIFHQAGFYRPSEEDYFFSLLYHALIHKPSVSDDYKVILSSLADKLKIRLSPADFSDRSRCLEVLNDFLNRNGYHFTEPCDISVYFNTAGTRVKKVSVSRLISSSQNAAAVIRVILEQTSDRSWLSHELQTPEIFRNGFLRRHFSCERADLLSLVNFTKTMHVLEFGAQSGVVTRFLGEKCGFVYAVEPDEQLAGAARIRCSDLENVLIVSELTNAENFRARFDCAVIIFEWPGNQTTQSVYPCIAKWIESAAYLLKDNGVLVFAVDNSESLIKTLLEKPKNGLTRYEICQLLKSYGFEAVFFNYSFPDHLYPQNIFTDDSLHINGKTVGNWASSTQFTDSKGVNIRSPLLGNLFIKFLSEGTFGNNAPSFIVLAGKKTVEKPLWIIKKFSRFPRRIEMHTGTELVRGKEAFIVNKSGCASEDGLFIFNPLVSIPLYEGEPLEMSLYNSLSAGDKATYISLLYQYVDYLRNTFAIPSVTTPGNDPKDCTVSGDAMDCNFSNIIISKEGWRHFDLEWKCKVPLPLSFVLFRALSVHINGIDVSKLAIFFTIRNIATKLDFIVSIIRSLNLPGSSLNIRYFIYYTDFEDRFYSFVFYKRRNKPSFLELYLPLYYCKDSRSDDEKKIYIESLQKEFPNITELDMIKNEYPALFV